MKDLIPKNLTAERREYLEGLDSVKELAQALSDMFVFEQNRAGKLIKKKRDLKREFENLRVTYNLMKEILDETTDACDAIKELKKIAGVKNE